MKEPHRNGEGEAVLRRIMNAITSEIESQVSKVDDVKLANPLGNLSETQELLEVNDIEDDEYWSDFSDEDHTVEESDEKDALHTFYELQSWLLAYLNENQDLDLVKMFRNFETKQGFIGFGDL